MKKFFALIFAVVLSTTFIMAAEPVANSTGPWNPDNNVTNGYTETNDFSFDYAVGEYKIFVICEIDITNITGNIYLGWLNPDGAKDLGQSYDMQFKVKGGNGWPFEATARFGTQPNSDNNVAYSNYEGLTNDYPTNNVFITGSTWKYISAGHTTPINAQQFTADHFTLSGVMGQFDGFVNGPKLGDIYGGGHGVDPQSQDYWENNMKIKKFWNRCDNCCGSNACQGEGLFVLTPGTVWASPDAVEGFYTFPVYVEVDYLTFKNVPNWYYPAGGNHPDPSAFSLHLQP